MPLVLNVEVLSVENPRIICMKLSINRSELCMVTLQNYADPTSRCSFEFSLNVEELKKVTQNSNPSTLDRIQNLFKPHYIDNPFSRFHGINVTQVSDFMVLQLDTIQQTDTDLKVTYNDDTQIWYRDIGALDVMKKTLYALENELKAAGVNTQNSVEQFSITMNGVIEHAAANHLGFSMSAITPEQKKLVKDLVAQHPSLESFLLESAFSCHRFFNTVQTTLKETTGVKEDRGSAAHYMLT